MLGSWGDSEWTSVRGYRVHAAVSARPGAPRVVLVHGLGVSHRYFRPLAAELAGTFDVAAPDLPGFGRTRGPRRALDVRGLSGALAGWLRETGRGGSLLVANSAGCQLVADLSLHAPDVLGPCVLIGPTFDPQHRTVREQASRLAAAMLREDPELGLVLARDYLACGPRRFFATLRLLLADRIEDKVGQLAVPVTVVRGEGDAIAPRRWVQEVASALPGARLEEVPGAGHALNWTAPGPVAGLVHELVPHLR